LSKPVELESARLRYLPIDTSYCSDRYLAWMNDPEVTRYLEVYKPYSLQELHDYLQKANDNKDLLFWAIHLKSNNKHIGNIKIDPVNTYHGTGEYGIMMGDRSEWGNGYAKEASISVIDYCFNILGLRKITLGVVEENIPAVSLYNSLGFETEGVYRDHGFYNGHYCNLLRMAVFNKNRS
jgi:[ribosomal protein S5]-alanine N-acetyltransferase